MLVQTCNMTLSRNAIMNKCGSVDHNCNCVTSSYQPVSANVSILCCVERMLRTEVIDDGNMCEWTSVLQFSWNDTILQIMLHISVTLHSNFLHRITLSRTAVVTYHSYRTVFWQCYIICLTHLKIYQCWLNNYTSFR